MAQGVEDGEQNEARCAGNGRNDRTYAINLLPDRRVGGELAGVSQPALENEGEIEGDDGYGGHGNEEGFKPLCADICERAWR